MKPKIHIVNIVVSAKIKNPVNIKKIVAYLPNTIYEPESFSGIIYHREVPKAIIIMK